MVGCFIPPGQTQLFAPMKTCNEYVSMVRRKATPSAGRQQPSVQDVKQADEDTRTLWADKMRFGATLREAVEETRAEVAALWLLTVRSDAANLRAPKGAGRGG